MATTVIRYVARMCIAANSACVQHRQHAGCGYSGGPVIDTLSCSFGPSKNDGRGGAARRRRKSSGEVAGDGGWEEVGRVSYMRWGGGGLREKTDFFSFRNLVWQRVCCS